MDSTPLSRSADPHTVDVFLARVAFFMLCGLDDAPPPGTTTALRQDQRYTAANFLETLATHRGWL